MSKIVAQKGNLKVGMEVSPGSSPTVQAATYGAREAAKFGRSDAVQKNWRTRRAEMKKFKKAQRQFRKDVRLGQSEALQQAKMTHDTIRYGISHLAGLGSEAIAGAAAGQITNNQNSDALDQNINGGMLNDGSTSDNESTGIGMPVTLGRRRGRKEE